MANDTSQGALPQTEEQNPGLPMLVLEIRARLGGDATPEPVAAEVRASGYPNTSDEDVRQLWDEGHLPPGSHPLYWRQADERLQCHALPP